MLHAAALIHDDVIDGSDRRHGTDTVHVEYAARHRDGAWRGDSDRFGAGVAILLGDLALAYSDRLLAGAPPAAVAVFDEVRLEVNVGQYLDILGAAQGMRAGRADGDDGRRGGDAEAVARARRICRYKTAKYTVERPLHLGAALAAPDRPASWPVRCRPSACPSARRSSSATTCSTCSAIRPSPANRSATTCGRASPPCSPPWPAPAPPGAAARLLEERFGAAAPVRCRGPRAAGGDRGDRRPGRGGSRHRAPGRRGRRGPRGPFRSLPEARRALGELAAFATGRDH